MIDLQLISKDIKQTRLTLTPTRTTIKFPLSANESEKNTAVEYANTIRESMEPITQSWRGTFAKGLSNKITLSIDSNKKYKTFVL